MESATSVDDTDPFPDQKGFTHIQLPQSGDETRHPRVDIAPQSVETPILLAGLWLAGVHGASARRNFPPRQR